MGMMAVICSIPQSASGPINSVPLPCVESIFAIRPQGHDEGAWHCVPRISTLHPLLAIKNRAGGLPPTLLHCACSVGQMLDLTVTNSG